jgi:hypothetical protein
VLLGPGVGIIPPGWLGVPVAPSEDGVLVDPLGMIVPGRLGVGVALGPGVPGIAGVPGTSGVPGTPGTPCGPDVPGVELQIVTALVTV